MAGTRQVIFRKGGKSATVWTSRDIRVGEHVEVLGRPSIAGRVSAVNGEVVELEDTEEELVRVEWMR